MVRVLLVVVVVWFAASARAQAPAVPGAATSGPNAGTSRVGPTPATEVSGAGAPAAPTEPAGSKPSAAAGSGDPASSAAAPFAPPAPGAGPSTPGATPPTSPPAEPAPASRDACGPADAAGNAPVEPDLQGALGPCPGGGPSPTLAPSRPAEPGPRFAPGARPMTDADRTRMRQSRIAVLRDLRTRTRLGGPIAAFTLSWLAFAGFESLWVDYKDVAVPLTVVGVAAAGVSTLWLVRTVRTRRAYAREIHALERAQLGVAPLVSPRATGLQLTLSF